jgi:hypothetical protein
MVWHMHPVGGPQVPLEKRIARQFKKSKSKLEAEKKRVAETQRRRLSDAEKQELKSVETLKKENLMGLKFTKIRRLSNRQSSVDTPGSEKSPSSQQLTEKQTSPPPNFVSTPVLYTGMLRGKVVKLVKGTPTIVDEAETFQDPISADEKVVVSPKRASKKPLVCFARGVQTDLSLLEDLLPVLMGGSSSSSSGMVNGSASFSSPEDLNQSLLVTDEEDQQVPRDGEDAGVVKNLAPLFEQLTKEAAEEQMDSVDHRAHEHADIVFTAGPDQVIAGEFLEAVVPRSASFSDAPNLAPEVSPSVPDHAQEPNGEAGHQFTPFISHHPPALTRGTGSGVPSHSFNPTTAYVPSDYVPMSSSSLISLLESKAGPAHGAPVSRPKSKPGGAGAGKSRRSQAPPSSSGDDAAAAGMNRRTPTAPPLKSIKRGNNSVQI